jgi:predicted CXXCH cytochrome family protein
MLSIGSSLRVFGRLFSANTLLMSAILVLPAYALEKADMSCAGCHTTRGLSTVLPSGESLQLSIDAGGLALSVHNGLRCQSCHTGITKFPHAKITATDYRDFQLKSSQQCQSCHQKQFSQIQDSNHFRALAAGNRNAAVCVDCHGNHDVTKPGRPRHKISTNCGKCHGAVYQQYMGSVHGKALLVNGNPDAPGCTDCHSAHHQEDPTTESFRLKSPKLCANCHANASMMRKYNITPNVFNTYVADFHGLTVTLFKKQQPDQRINTAVCTDCHGIHDMQEVTAANSSVVKENLLTTCRKCHPDATASFPDSWVGHFLPSRDRYPLVYYVTLFYRYVIPITIGGMILFVLIDAGGRIVRRTRKNRT